MKYVRTKDDKIYKLLETKSKEKYLVKPNELIPLWNTNEYEILKQADNLDELCDFAYALYDDNVFETYDLSYDTITLKQLCSYLMGGKVKEVYYGIKTNEGLIYKAKMKGVLPNGEIDWELL